MRYCSTWLRSLLCYIKKCVIEEFIIKVLHCIYVPVILIPQIQNCSQCWIGQQKIFLNVSVCRQHTFEPRFGDLE